MLRPFPSSFVLLWTLFLVGCSAQINFEPVPPKSTPPIEPVDNTPTAKTKQLLVFTSPVCHACVVDKPELSRLERRLKRHGVEVVKIDVTQSPELAAQWGVTQLPTYVVCEDGREINRFTIIRFLIRLLKFLWPLIFI